MRVPLSASGLPGQAAAPGLMVPLISRPPLGRPPMMRLPLAPGPPIALDDYNSENRPRLTETIKC